MGFSTRLFIALGVALLVSAGGAFFFSSNNALALGYDSVCEGNPPFCAGTSPSWTETQYRCTSNTCGAQKLIRTRSCSEGENTIQASVCTEAGWSSPVCQSFSSCGAWTERIIDQDPYMVCSGSTQWTENEPSIFCSAQQCYPIPEIKTLQDEDLFPKNVFETGTNKIKLPVNVGWSSTNKILEKDGSVCRADSYEYQITGGGSAYTKRVLSSVRICSDTVQECRDVWEEAREREDVAAMNRAKAIADEIRKEVTDPTGDNPIHSNPPSPQYPTYNFLTGQYDYVLAHQQEVTQDVVRRAFEACVLNPGTSYQLRVRACSDENGADCQKWDGTNLLSFSTSLAPELISPYDPDWEGPNSSITDTTNNLQSSARFRWCSTMQQHATSFLFQSFDSFPVASSRSLIEEQELGLNSTTHIGMPEFLKVYFSSHLKYFWRLVPCVGGSCNSQRSSQAWSIAQTVDTSRPNLLTPNGAVLNMTNALEWAQIAGAEYYLIHIKGPELTIIRPVRSLLFPLDRAFWLPNLEMNTAYTWRIAGCGGQISDDPSLCIKEEGKNINWSQQRTFYTTGEAPEYISISPRNTEGRVAIPISLEWYSGTQGTGVRGAASYYYAITAGQTRISSFSNQPSIALTYAQGMRPATTYQMEVRTCAEEVSSLSLGQENTFCGPAKIVEFSTLAQPDPPIITAPGTNAAVRPSIGWDPSFGSNYYKYEVIYKEMIDEPNTQLCSPLVGSVVASNKNNIALGISYPTNLQCFGSYTLKVSGCIDTDTNKTQCIEQGEIASHTFTIGASSAPTAFGGLVPCGRENFNRDTPWDDREPCGIQHVFLGLWTLLNFVLWRLTPILLVLGAMATGAVLYFLSYNAPSLLAQIKSGWKAFGIGVLIMLFSWFFLNLFLGLLGFDVTVFGRWYEVTL